MLWLQMREETKKLLFLSAELTVESRWYHYQQTVVLDSPSRRHILQHSPAKHMDAPFKDQLDENYKDRLGKPDPF